MTLQTYGAPQLDQIIAAGYAAAMEGQGANIGVGSQFGPSFKAVRLAMQLLQSENAYIDAISRLSTMQDPLNNGQPNPDVDSFINQYGVYRQGPDNTTGTEQFNMPSNVTQDLTIPVGLIVGNGTTTYTVVPGGAGYNPNANGYVMIAGTSTVNALIQCTASGAVGNAVSGTIDQVISAPFGIPVPSSLTCTNPLGTDTDPTDFSNGINAEVGQPLKTRFANFMSGGGEGSVNSILASVAGVQAGLTYSYGDLMSATLSGSNWIINSAPLGGFVVVANIANQNALPPQSLLDAIRATLLYDIRAAGMPFSIIPPTLVPVAGGGTVYVPPGINAAPIVANVNAAFQTFINGIGLDQYGNPTVASLMAVYVALSQQVAGVNGRIDGLTLNGSAADVSAAFGSQLVAGSANFVAA
jgi:hypothetical protein